MAEDIKQDIEYGSDSIRTLDWKEHIRRRPGMYIGKLGDGTHADDGIYVLLKEVIDNAIDEFMMGYGNKSSSTSKTDGYRYATTDGESLSTKSSTSLLNEHRCQIRLKGI